MAWTFPVVFRAENSVKCVRWSEYCPAGASGYPEEVWWSKIRSEKVEKIRLEVARWTLSTKFISTKVLCTWNNIHEVRPSSPPPRLQLCYQLPPSTTGQPAVFGVPLSVKTLYVHRTVRPTPFMSRHHICARQCVLRVPCHHWLLTARFVRHRRALAVRRVTYDVGDENRYRHVFCPAPFGFIPTSITRPVKVAYSCFVKSSFCVCRTTSRIVVFVYWSTSRSTRLPRDVQP